MTRLRILISCAMLVASASAAAPSTAAASSQRAAAKRAGGSSARPSATATQPPAPVTQSSAPGDSGLTIPGGKEGAVFKSLTVEGEDRVHFDFARPALKLELDPASAPGLNWGSARDVLDRTVPDLEHPLVGISSRVCSPYLAHPWLGHFVTGAVARFRPELKGVDRWKLTIVNARGENVASYQGKGEPPSEIAWDGRSQSGAPVAPGLTYSYVLEAHDRAGNKRNFVGQGFRISAYRLDTEESLVMVFSGRELTTAEPGFVAGAASEAAASLLIEAASWVNQRPQPGQPVRVTATARSFEEAQALASTVTRQLAPRVLGGPGRLMAATEIQPDAPEGGTVKIATGRQATTR